MTVGHHDLAMVPQVRPASKRDVQHGHEIGDLPPCLEQGGQEAPADAPRADVVEQETDRHSLLGLLRQTVPQILTDRSAIEDVGGDVDRRPGLLDDLHQVMKRDVAFGQKLGMVIRGGRRDAIGAQEAIGAVGELAERAALGAAINAGPSSRPSAASFARRTSGRAERRRRGGRSPGGARPSCSSATASGGSGRPGRAARAGTRGEL